MIHRRINYVDPPKYSYGGSILSGAGSGAALGSSIMPGWGTLIGGVIGAGAGFFKEKSSQNAEDKQKKREEELVAKQQLFLNKQADRQILSQFPVYGVNQSFFKYGGNTGNPPDGINDVLLGNVHFTPKFTPSRFNLAKNGAVSGKWSVPKGIKTFKGVANVDVIFPLLDILRQEYEIRNSENPKETRKLIEERGNRAVKRLSDPDNPLYQESEILRFGGTPNPEYEAEGGEIIEHSANPLKKPKTSGGKLEKLSNTTSKIKGKSHEKGGIPMSGGDRIFSDKLPAPLQLLKLSKKL